MEIHIDREKIIIDIKGNTNNLFGSFSKNFM